jgi:hypothetical protein
MFLLSTQTKADVILCGMKVKEERAQNTLSQLYR